MEILRSLSKYLFRPAFPRPPISPPFGPSKWLFPKPPATSKFLAADLSKTYPDYAGQGYEIAGFAWWHGPEDQSDVHTSHCEQNLVCLIKSMPNDYDAPNAPFLLAVGCATCRKSFGLPLAKAQPAMNDAKKHPAFARNVKCVNFLDCRREPAAYPGEQGFQHNPTSSST